MMILHTHVPRPFGIFVPSHPTTQVDRSHIGTLTFKICMLSKFSHYGLISTPLSAIYVTACMIVSFFFDILLN